MNRRERRAAKAQQRTADAKHARKMIRMHLHQVDNARCFGCRESIGVGWQQVIDKTIRALPISICNRCIGLQGEKRGYQIVADLTEAHPPEWGVSEEISNLRNELWVQLRDQMWTRQRPR